MKKFLQSNFVKGAVATSIIFSVTAAQAALDVSSSVTEISGNKSTISEIGLACFGLAVAAVLFRYLKKAL